MKLFVLFLGGLVAFPVQLPHFMDNFLGWNAGKRKTRPQITSTDSIPALKSIKRQLSFHAAIPEIDNIEALTRVSPRNMKISFQFRSGKTIPQERVKYFIENDMLDDMAHSWGFSQEEVSALHRAYYRTIGKETTQYQKSSFAGDPPSPQTGIQKPISILKDNSNRPIIANQEDSHHVFVSSIRKVFDRYKKKDPQPHFEHQRLSIELGYRDDQDQIWDKSDFENLALLLRDHGYLKSFDDELKNEIKLKKEFPDSWTVDDEHYLKLLIASKPFVDGVKNTFSNISF